MGLYYESTNRKAADMHANWRLIVGLTCALCLVAGTTTAADDDRIVFLHLTKAGAEVRLDSTATVPGHLKSPKRTQLNPEPLHFEAKNAQGDVVFEGSTSDPTQVRHEYVDQLGRLQTFIEKSDTASFTIRIPYDSAMRSVRFSTIESVTAADQSKSIRTVDLGTVIMPAVADE